MTIEPAHPLRILLIDDDPDDCEFFRAGISESGLYASLIIRNGCEGVQELLQQEHALPHLIFLDLIMPEISGTSCLNRLRNAASLKNIPIIIFSTSCHLEQVDETFSNGASLFIQKPASFTLLVNILKKVLTLDWKKYLKERTRSEYVFGIR